MVDETSRRRVMRTGCAMGAALFFMSPMAEAQVSGATCNLQAGGGVFSTAVIVWVDGVRTEVQIGERGLTRDIAFSNAALLDWMRREFADGDPEVRVGFNDCSGSQTAPLSEPPEDEDDPPAPIEIAPPASAPEPDEKPPCNDCFISTSGSLSDDTIIGDGWDELYA